jgi:pilus assembly protein CpaB
MKPKTMILMVVAVACGLVASYMTSRLLADRNAPADNMVDVVVAKKKVQQLTLLRKPEDFFEVRSVKEDGPITAKAFKSLDELKDKRMKNTVNADSVLRPDDLQKKEDQTIDIPVGQRAIAIKVNAECLAGGFILPGMRVDILSTVRTGAEASSMILLQNMLVLAIGEDKVIGEGKVTMVGKTATLAATPQECMQLMLAQQQGEMLLTLRSNEDKRLVTSSSTKVSDLGKGVRDRTPETSDGSPDNTDNNPGFIPGLPKVATDPTPPTPMVEPQPVKEAPKGEQHTLTVSEGASTQQFLFTKDPETGAWRGGRFNKENDDEAPARKPATKPAPESAPKADATPGDNTTAPAKRVKQ